MVLGFEGFVALAKLVGVLFDFLEDVDLYLAVPDLFLQLFYQFLLSLLKWVIFEGVIERRLLLCLNILDDVGVEAREFCCLFIWVQRVTALRFAKLSNISFI